MVCRSTTVEQAVRRVSSFASMQGASKRIRGPRSLLLSAQEEPSGSRTYDGAAMGEDHHRAGTMADGRFHEHVELSAPSARDTWRFCSQPNGCAPCFRTAAKMWPVPRIARKAGTAPAGASRSSSSRPLLATRPDVASTRAAAAPTAVPLPVEDKGSRASAGAHAHRAGNPDRPGHGARRTGPARSRVVNALARVSGSGE